jgi:triphosphoribosyl-dephospho-CoA synthase
VLKPAEIRRFYLSACRAELRALKPGNVHAYAAGHGMTVADFEASAEASADAMANPRLSVGTRIYRAIRQSRAVAGCNTNLGIVLLCAPLAEAGLHGRGLDLRRRLVRVLGKLDRRDASYAFRAISLANPGGLGDAPRHDVHRPARVTLLSAMVHARRRDAIARQYATGYAAIFRIGIPTFWQASKRWNEANWAVSATYLAFLSAFPDSHVQRKFGLPEARALRKSAGMLHRRLLGAKDPCALRSPLLRLDAALKAKGINPGTSADLTVATLFAAALERGIRTAEESPRQL